MKEPIKQYKPAEKLELSKIKKEFPKIFKKVNCPSCTEEISAAHIDLPTAVAKCGGCNAIFSIKEEVASLDTKKEMKQELFRPEGVDLFYFKEDMEIAVQQPIHWVDMSGALFLPLIAIFTTFLCYEKGISIYIPIFFAIGSLFFIYRAFKYRKAKTYIDINERFMTIKHRPNNFKTDQKFLVEDVDQIYLKHSTTNSGYFALHAIVNSSKGQKHQSLIEVSTLSKAKYLEQEIEKYLGIEDRKVPEATV